MLPSFSVLENFGGCCMEHCLFLESWFQSCYPAGALVFGTYITINTRVIVPVNCFYTAGGRSEYYLHQVGVCHLFNSVSQRGGLLQK